MFNLLRADFYKLIKRKAFYVCLIFVLALSGLAFWDQYVKGREYVEMFPDYFNSLMAVKIVLGLFGIFITIMTSVFVTSEFSYGTMKNMVSSGQSRLKIYLSKLATSFGITIIYNLASVVFVYVLGSVLWGSKGLALHDYLEAAKVVGIYMLIDLAMQSFFVMIAFVIRSSGYALTVNLLTDIFVIYILGAIESWVVAFFKLSTQLNLASYCPEFYRGSTLATALNSGDPTDIIKCLIVCGGFIIGSTLLGALTFSKRDVH